jgi:DNA-binding response OmpR family regulator
MQRALVLIVDASRATRDMYADFLRHHGYEVAEAGDCTEGVRVFRALRPDVVVTELTGGPESAEAISEMRAATPAGESLLIACSTYVEQHRPSLAEIGLDAALPKPTSPRALLREIEWLLAQRQARSAVA